MQKGFILSKRPQEYLKQGINHCGAFSVKGILSAFGKDIKKDPRDYHPHWLGKWTGTTFGISYWSKVLKSYGLEVTVGNASSLTDEGRLKLLKTLLSQDGPIMLRTGNGYLPNGGYNPLKAALIGHWITMWGYDEIKHVFYVYDSAMSPHLYDRNIPIGNKTRTYSEILRDWKGGLFPWPWRYAYIYIKNSI